MDSRYYLTISFLCALSAILLSVPWLLPHTGFLALFALVPLLCADRIASMASLRRFWIWHYLTFVLWNALTTFWVCNATLAGGIFAILANALQMSLIWGVFRFSKKFLHGILPYILLFSLWIAWERWYLVSAQISWPWLVLGNAFATSVKSVQWYSVTGTLGGSLWVWLSNLGIFGMMAALSDGRWFAWNGKAKVAAVVGVSAVLALPFVVSVCMFLNYEERSERSVEFVIGQPNFDPYHKFELLTQAQQTEALFARFDEKVQPEDSCRALTFLAPETFTSDIVTDRLDESPTVKCFKDYLRKLPHSSIVFGASAYDYVTTRSMPTPLAYEYGNGWLVSHNSAIVADADGCRGITHKSKLVVGTELTPYPAVFIPLEKLICRISGMRGPLMGRCVGQDAPGVLHLKDGTTLGCAVCYESVYGEYCKGYVDRGAGLLAVITNDAWWGNTPGYRQHLSYSCLRAIELRRDLVRCGNTGVSCFINQRGEIVQRGPWWEEASLRGTVNVNSGKSVFAQYGDITGRACTLVMMLMLCLLLVRILAKG